MLGVRLDTVKSWSAGRNPTPAGVIEDLKGLAARQSRAASEVLDKISELAREHGAPDEVELSYPSDDHEAQSIGWPCVGAWRAMAARIIAESRAKVILVPRGSTASGALAADTRERFK